MFLESKMFLKRQGQSTAEYAIVIGLVVAVAAGVLQIALKNGIQAKNAQGMKIMTDAGNTELTAAGATMGANPSTALYSQDLRKTTVDHATYVDKTVTKQGGAVDKKQYQETVTDAVNVETIGGSTN